VAYPNRGRELQQEGSQRDERRWISDGGAAVADAEVITERAGLREAESRIFRRRRFGDSHWWAVEPDVGRVAYGVSARVDRLRGLGNAIVPQIAEWIARRILAAEGLA
jgi:DNA (cytosine-5)-methyltransferase 1